MTDSNTLHNLVRAIEKKNPEFTFEVNQMISKKQWRDIGRYYASGKSKFKDEVEKLVLIKVGDMAYVERNKSYTFTEIPEKAITVKNIADYVIETDFVSIVKDINNDVSKKNQRSSALANKAEILASEDDNEVLKPEYGDLSVHINYGTYSTADKEFFKWFYRDAYGNIYAKVSDGYLPIHFTPDGTRVREGSEFWSRFYKAYGNYFKSWTKTVHDYFMHDINPTDFDISRLRYSVDGKISAIEYLHTLIPKVILNNSFVKVTKSKFEDEKGNEHTTVVDADLTLRLSTFTEKGVANTETNWFEMLSGIIPDIESLEFQMLKRYSPDPNTPAIWHYNTALLEPNKVMPVSWKKFFSNKFKIDREAQLYRICKFITLLLKDNNRNRQALVIAGNGKEGKSLFCDVLIKGFNTLFNCNHSAMKYATDVSAEAFQDGQSARGALDKIMDAMLVYIPDVGNTSELLNTPKLKAITGSDPVTADIKNVAPVKRALLGTKVIISTNACTRMSDTATSSRVIPVWFSRSEDDNVDFDMYEMGNRMVEEFVDFLKFSYFYCSYIETKFKINPEECINQVAIFSSDNTAASIKAVFESLGDKRKFFMYNTAIDYDEEIEALNADICEELGIEEDTSSKVTCRELYKQLPIALQNLGYSALRNPFSIPTSKERKSFKAYLKKVFNIEEIISNGKRYYDGIKFRPPVPEEKLYNPEEHPSSRNRDAQAWANSIPKKEHREDNKDYSAFELDDSIV